MATFAAGPPNGTERAAPPRRFDLPEEPINDAAVEVLMDPWRSLVFSDGTMYRVPQVPYNIGRRLSRIQRQLVTVAALAQEAADGGTEFEEPPEYWAMLNEIRRLCRRHLRPIGRGSFLRRQLWRMRLHDPLRGRSEGELATVAGFFQRLRMSRANPSP